MNEQDRAATPHSVCDVLRKLKTLGEEAGDQKVRLGDVLETLGHRAYGPFFVLLPLIEISPAGGIPGIPTAIALTMALLALQLVAGREHFWLPGFLAKRGLSGRKLAHAATKVEPIGRFMDRWFHGRLESLTKGPMLRLAGAAIILLCLTVPPLELLPFASTAPMLAIQAFGVALLVRDGVLMLVACAFALAAVGVGIGLFAQHGPSSGG